MGYTTDFYGVWEVTPALTRSQADYLRAFAWGRRVTWNPVTLEGVADPIREAVGLPIGHQGRYFTGHIRINPDKQPWEYGYLTDAPGWGSHRGQRQGDWPVKPVLDEPPKGEPGYWCQWQPSDDGHYIEWDQGEKFYAYVEWIDYLMQHFFKRWGVVLDGEIEWIGEDASEDQGCIRIKDNQIEVGVLERTFNFKPIEDLGYRVVQEALDKLAHP